MPETVRCAKCRHMLMSSSALVGSHGLETASDQNCSQGQQPSLLFVNKDQLPDFIIEQVNLTARTKGKLKCPSCQITVGSHDFIQPRRCSCGNTQVPNISLHSKKVDLIPAPEMKIDRDVEIAVAAIDALSGAQNISQNSPTQFTPLHLNNSQEPTELLPLPPNNIQENRYIVFCHSAAGMNSLHPANLADSNLKNAEHTFTTETHVKTWEIISVSAYITNKSNISSTPTANSQAGPSNQRTECSSSATDITVSTNQNLSSNSQTHDESSSRPTSSLSARPKTYPQYTPHTSTSDRAVSGGCRRKDTQELPPSWTLPQYVREEHNKENRSLELSTRLSDTGNLTSQVTLPENSSAQIGQTSNSAIVGKETDNQIPSTSGLQSAHSNTERECSTPHTSELSRRLSEIDNLAEPQLHTLTPHSRPTATELATNTRPPNTRGKCPRCKEQYYTRSTQTNPFPEIPSSEEEFEEFVQNLLPPYMRTQRPPPTGVNGNRSQPLSRESPERVPGSSSQQRRQRAGEGASRENPQPERRGRHKKAKRRQPQASQQGLATGGGQQDIPNAAEELQIDEQGHVVVRRAVVEVGDLSEEESDVDTSGAGAQHTSRRTRRRRRGGKQSGKSDGSEEDSANDSQAHNVPEEPDYESLCAVCYEVIYRPHTVEPCQHTFCVACLWHLTRYMTPHNILCPMCRGLIVRCVPNEDMCRLVQEKFPVSYAKRENVVKKQSKKGDRLPVSFPGFHHINHNRRRPPRFQAVQRRDGRFRRILVGIKDCWLFVGHILYYFFMFGIIMIIGFIDYCQRRRRRNQNRR